jgi:hypothetical protein
LSNTGPGREPVGVLATLAGAFGVYAALFRIAYPVYGRDLAAAAILVAAGAFSLAAAQLRGRVSEPQTSQIGLGLP